MENVNLKTKYKPAYTDEDAGLGFIFYIIMQGIIFFVVRSIISSGVPFTNLFYYIYAFLVEGVFALAVLVVCLIKKKSFVQASGLNKKVNISLVGLCVGISVVCLLGLGGVSDFFMQILEWLGYSSEGAGIQVTTFWELLIYTILIAAMPAFCEELLFRGLMQNALSKYGKHLSVFITAFSFMIMHGSPDQTVHQFILGIIFGYIVYYTGNLWLTIIIHFCNNFFVLVANFIYNISASGSTITDSAGAITQGTNVGYQIVNYIISVVLVAISVYLIYSAIKMIVKNNKELNGVPDHVSEGDRKRFGILDQVNVNEETSGEVVVHKVSGQELNVNAKPKMSYIAIVLLSAANIYLIIEWILALIEGLG